MSRANEKSSKSNCNFNLISFDCNNATFIVPISGCPGTADHFISVSFQFSGQSIHFFFAAYAECNVRIPSAGKFFLHKEIAGCFQLRIHSTWQDWKDRIKSPSRSRYKQYDRSSAESTPGRGSRSARSGCLSEKKATPPFAPCGGSQDRW